jgi:hypothetical protein
MHAMNTFVQSNKHEEGSVVIYTKTVVKSGVKEEERRKCELRRNGY